jgi:uncharacterized protein (TIGR02996 family)
MTTLDALTAACLDAPDDGARLAVLADWLEERGDARAAPLRRLGRWRDAVAAARAEEAPDERGDMVARVRATAEALGDADARLWACSCLRLLPLPGGGAGPAPLAGPRRRRAVAAAELFACGLLGADALRAARAEALGAEVVISCKERAADPGPAVLWAVAEPDGAQAEATFLGAALLFLGKGGRAARLSLARRAVAAARRMLREHQGPADAPTRPGDSRSAPE